MQADCEAEAVGLRSTIKRSGKKRVDCGWDGGQGGRLLEGNTKGWRVSRQHVYQTARWWRRWAERGRGEGGEWSRPLAADNGCICRRIQPLALGGRGTTGPGLPKHVGRLPHTHTDAHTCQHARTHSSAPSKISQARKRIDSFFIFNARADGGAAVLQEEEEGEKKLLA